MGLRFRKSFKIAPGVRVNVGKKGVSSLSVGRPGANINIGKRGSRANIGIPGSGLSYSTRIGRANNTRYTRTPILTGYPVEPRKVSILLGLGIFFIPYIFAWFTLKQGYSSNSRVLSFGWLALTVVVWVFGAK